MKKYLVASVLALAASPAFAQTNLDVGSTGIQGFDNLVAIVVRILQVIFFLGGFAYLGFAGLSKGSGDRDANDKIRDAVIGGAIAIGAPVLMEVIKRAMGV